MRTQSNICSKYDIIADGTDNFPTRYLVNDACVLLGKPNVHASIFGFEGRASVFDAATGPCYRCLYPSPPERGEVPSCAEGGVLGVLPGMLGVIQATEIIKLILGIGNSLTGRMICFDALQMQSHELRFSKNRDCPICGPNRTIHELVDYHRSFGFCEINTAPDAGGVEEYEIDARELKALLSNGSRSIVVLDVREQAEWDIFRIEGAIHVPANDLAQRIGEFDTSGTIVVYCLSGVRSRRAVDFMREAGFKHVRTLVGGIQAWMNTDAP
jgi:rhodanese-related sulfurtransferase